VSISIRPDYPRRSGRALLAALAIVLLSASELNAGALVVLRVKVEWHAQLLPEPLAAAVLLRDGRAAK
jgi:hypothetical protein